MIRKNKYIHILIVILFSCSCYRGIDEGCNESLLKHVETDDSVNECALYLKLLKLPPAQGHKINYPIFIIEAHNNSNNYQSIKKECHDFSIQIGKSTWELRYFDDDEITLKPREKRFLRLTVKAYDPDNIDVFFNEVSKNYLQMTIYYTRNNTNEISKVNTEHLVVCYKDLNTNEWREINDSFMSSVSE